MDNFEIRKFVQKNSPGGTLNRAVQGEFLQSEEWRKFQEAVGRKTFCISSDNFHASIIEHKLPIVGNYFYIPRGPVIPVKAGIQENLLDSGSGAGMTSLLDLAKKEKAGWIRFDANNSYILGLIRSHWRVVKAPHDMQPREILIMDITKSEEELLAEMKPKTRYNVRLAEKKGVTINVIPAQAGIQENLLDSGFHQRRTGTAGMTNEYINEFIKLVKITAKRDKIMPHPESYYRKMFEVMPSDILKLYIAEYEGKIIAANIVIFYGNTATYLHGASDYNYRNTMAPYLLQWQAMRDAKKNGFTKYDLGGVKISNFQFPISNKIPNSKFQIPNFASNSWQGITRFKTGFAPDTKPIIFPGSYDIVLKPFQYNLYRILQKIKSLF